MKNRFSKKMTALFVTVILAAQCFFFIGNTWGKSRDTDSLGLEYIEDKSGDMNLEEAQEKFESGSVYPVSNAMFSFGKSAATYWIRLPLGELKPSIRKEYISVYNATVKRAVLYLPVIENGNFRYKEFDAGWSFGEKRQDGGFFYPIFRWDNDTDFKEDAYIQLSSDLTQNYKIGFLTQDELEHDKIDNIMLHGILFGILAAMAILNLIIFMELRDKASLYYVFYILSMIIYQGNLMGSCNAFAPQYSSLIMSNTVTMAMAAMTAFIIFFREFFGTREFLPEYDKVLRSMFLFIFASGIFILLKQPVLANMYAHVLSSLMSIFVMFVAFKAHKRGFGRARLFMLGWIFMVSGLIESFFRHTGWTINDSVTINVTFIAVVIQSILLSAALVKRMKLLTEERENALMQYREAEENAQSNEIAFLQAQIKPHFLYNVLNVIISLCRIDSEKARELLLDLSEFLRHTFDFHNNQKLVLLEDELEYVQAYVRIEQARFKDKLDVKYEIGDVGHFAVPPLILQPLVENAIIHGIRKKNGAGKVILRMYEEDGSLKIEVEDDGLGITNEEIDSLLNGGWSRGKGIGVKNINKRLCRLYGEGLRIESVPERGTKISMTIGKGTIGYDKSCSDR